MKNWLPLPLLRELLWLLLRPRLRGLRMLLYLRGLWLPLRGLWLMLRGLLWLLMLRGLRLLL
jgi:hypothetical protein